MPTLLASVGSARQALPQHLRRRTYARAPHWQAPHLCCRRAGGQVRSRKSGQGSVCCKSPLARLPKSRSGWTSGPQTRFSRPASPRPPAFPPIEEVQQWGLPGRTKTCHPHLNYHIDREELPVDIAHQCSGGFGNHCVFLPSSSWRIHLHGDSTPTEEDHTSL